MANKINRTDIYPNTTPANGDYVLGVDVSNTTNDENGEVVTFRVNDILATSHNHQYSDIDGFPKFFDTIADLLADTTTYTAGTILITSKEGARYTALASGATDFSDTNAGGQKLMRGYQNYNTVSGLIASVEPSRGEGLIWEAEGFQYKEADSGATNHNIANAAGVKFYAQRLTLKSLGLTGSGTETAKYIAALASVPAGAFLEVDVDVTVDDTGIISANGVHVFGQKTITQTGANKKTISFTGAENCSVSGVTFVGKGTEHNGASSSYNGVAAVHFEDPINCKVDGIKATNHAGGAVRWTGSAEGLIVTRCNIVGIGAAGGISAGDNNGDFAIGSISSTADNRVIVSQNDISAHCFGVALNRGVGCIIENNIIHDIPGQHGAYCVENDGLIMSGNVVYSIANEGLKNQINTNNTVLTSIQISDNLLWDIGQSGIVAAFVTGVTGSKYTKSKISGNVLDDIGFYGMTLLGFSGSVTDNDVTRTGAHGALLRDFSGEIKSLTLDTTDWTAFWLEASGDVYISDLKITDGAQNSLGAATQLQYQVFAWITRYTGITSIPKITLKNPTFANAATLSTDVTNCIRTASTVEIYCDGIDQRIGKPWRFDTLKRMSVLQAVGADFTVGASLNPATPIYGRGRRELYGTQDPATASMTDYFRQGDVCWDATPSAGGKMGWVCVTSGTPGTWKPFGAIDA